MRPDHCGGQLLPVLRRALQVKTHQICLNGQQVGWSALIAQFLHYCFMLQQCIMRGLLLDFSHSFGTTKYSTSDFIRQDKLLATKIAQYIPGR